MPQLPGTVVIDKLVPTDSADNYGTHEDKYGIGGLHTDVLDTNERDNIPVDRRKEGMVVYVKSPTPTNYQLIGGITNANWVVFSGGSGSERVYIFDTSATPTGNIYNSMSALLAAGLAVKGHKKILIKNAASPATPIDVAAGTYDFKDYSIEYQDVEDAFGGFGINFLAGTTITTWFESVNCGINFNNTVAPVFTLSTGAVVVDIGELGSLSNAGTQAVFAVATGTTTLVVTKSISPSFNNTALGQEIFEFTSGGTIVLYVLNKTGEVSTTSYLFRGTGTIQIAFANGEPAYTGSNPSYVGTPTVITYLYGHVIENNGTPVSQMKTLNFTGAGVSTSNSGGKTVVTIPGGGASGNVVIFDPNIGASSGIRYKTFAEIQTALNAIDGTKYVLIHHTTPFANISIPAGTYDFQEVRFSCTPQTLLPTLDFADGTTITNFFVELEANVTLRFNNTTAPVHTVSFFSALTSTFGTIRNTGSQVVFDIPTGTTFAGILRAESTFLANSYEIFSMVTGGTLQLLVHDYALIRSNTANILRGTGGTLQIYDHSLKVGNESGYDAQANYSGTFNATNVVLRSELRAKELTYALSIPKFIVDPAATPFENTFTSLQALVASDTFINSPSPRIIEVDLSAGNLAVPAGSYALGGCYLVRRDNSEDNSALQFAAGTAITEFPISSNVRMSFANTVTPAKSITSAGSYFMELYGNGALINTGSVTIISVAHASAIFNLTLKDKAELLVTGSSDAIDAAVSGATVNLKLYDNSNYTEGTVPAIDGIGGTVINKEEYRSITKITPVSGSGTVAVDLSKLGSFEVSPTGAAIILDLKYPRIGNTYAFVMKQGGTPYSITFNQTIKWKGGSAYAYTNSASAIDIVTLYWDGTNYYGTYGLAYA